MSTFTNISLIPLLIGWGLSTGCGEDASNDAICGGHGEMHDGHCHCDAGFSLAEDGTSCDTNSGSEGSASEGDFIFEPSLIQASTGQSNNSQIWLLEAIDDDVQLKIEIYESYGGISSPGSMTLDDVETNYATCGTCILIQTGCIEHGDHYDCNRTFMPITGGEVHIEKIGTNADDQFSGQLLGLSFQEVRIGQDYETQPIAGGEELHLAPWTFDTILEELGGS